MNHSVPSKELRELENEDFFERDSENRPTGMPTPIRREIAAPIPPENPEPPLAEIPRPRVEPVRESRNPAPEPRRSVRANKGVPPNRLNL